jgi:hypothetical protein
MAYAAEGCIAPEEAPPVILPQLFAKTAGFRD